MIDKATRIEVEIGAGELTSATRSNLLAGSNSAAVVDENGEWEIFQFETAELVGERTYALSGLLRGQAGTESVMRAAGTRPVGSRIVFISEALSPVDISIGEIRLPLNWRVGPAAFDIGHQDYATRSHTFRGIGFRPYAPVHLRGRRDSGDLQISWIRRTRIGGDNWELPEVPLGEDEESYEVDVLNGANVVRTLKSTTPSVDYTLAQQTEDFGGPQASVSVAVYQISGIFGRGSAARAVL